MVHFTLRISLFLRLSLSLKFGTRPKISEEVKSIFFRLDSQQLVKLQFSVNRLLISILLISVNLLIYCAHCFYVFSMYFIGVSGLRVLPLLINGMEWNFHRRFAAGIRLVVTWLLCTSTKGRGICWRQRGCFGIRITDTNWETDTILNACNITE